jgi:hypothetical protein
MEIIRKLGGYKSVVGILMNNGWEVKKPYSTLVLQSWRQNLSRDVSLILWDYCLKHNIPVSIDDFREKAE